MHRRTINGDHDGFVVKGKAPGMYLDFEFQWRCHEMPEGAYVHSREVVAAGGTWTEHVHSLIPAHYDCARDTTKTTGEPIPYPVYLAGLATAGVE